MVLGALGAGEAGAVHEITLRRYQCQSCGAVLTVGPWDLLPGMLYSLVTVVLALARWGRGQSMASVRAHLSAFAVVGVSAQGRWASLRRWTRCATEGQLLSELNASLSGTLRQRAHRVVQILAGAGPPDSGLAERALHGARHFR